jgi:2-polyprenyl-3-methyl-5-hydroxy-6-metoxy-1,4-benzoquinol methylase
MGELAALLKQRPIVLERIRTVCRFVRGGRVLDLGAGRGRYAVAFAKRGFRVTAIDSSPGALAIIRALSRAAGVRARTVRADIARYRPRVGFYDVVLAVMSLHFLRGPQVRRAIDRIRHAKNPAASISSRPTPLATPRARVRTSSSPGSSSRTIRAGALSTMRKATVSHSAPNAPAA